MLMQFDMTAMLMHCITLHNLCVVSVRIVALAAADRAAAHLLGSHSSDQQCLGLQPSLLHQPPRAGHHGCHAQGIPSSCQHPHRAGLPGPGTAPSGCWHEQQGVAKLTVRLHLAFLIGTMSICMHAMISDPQRIINAAQLECAISCFMMQ